MATETTFKQDPNTPKYNATTGLLTDYGKSLGLKEVNMPTTINSGNLGQRTETNLPSNLTTTDYTPLNSKIIATTTDAANLSDAEAAKIAFLEKKSLENQKISSLMGDVGQEGAMIKQEAEKQGAYEAKKAYDTYRSQLEAEDLALLQTTNRLRENMTGMLESGQVGQIDDATRKSMLNKATLAIYQNAAAQRYETAMSIAKDKVEIELAPKKAELEALKYVIDNNKAYDTAEYNSILNRKQDELDKEKKKLDTIEALKVEAVRGGLKDTSVFNNIQSVDQALKVVAPYIATSQNEIKTLENGNTVVIDKRTGRVINNIGGGKAPTQVVQTVGNQPVLGYTLQKGDDPYMIALDNGIDMATLQKLNPKVTDWRNLPVGATINIPQSPEDAFITYLKGTEGGKALTDTSIQKLDKGLTVLNQLGTLQANVEGLKTGPIVGAFKNANPWDTQAQTIKASLNAIVPNLARGVYGEVGVLTDNDIKTYSQTIPNLKSTEEVRNAVLYITLDMIGKSIKNTLNVNAAAGRDVSGFTDIYTEMEATKNSILSQIPGAQVPQAFTQKNEDTFLNQFTPSSINSSISNSDFFKQF